MEQCVRARQHAKSRGARLASPLRRVWSDRRPALSLSPFLRFRRALLRPRAAQEARAPLHIKSSQRAAVQYPDAARRRFCASRASHAHAHTKALYMAP